MKTPVEKCPRCTHAIKLHDQARGCRCSFTERDPERGRCVVVCGCRWHVVVQAITDGMAAAAKAGAA